MKQVFRVKKLVGLLPQLELLAVVSRKLGHDNMGTQTQTDCACIFLYVNPSSFGVVSNNLAS